jgi:hypothetical protein
MKETSSADFILWMKEIAPVAFALLMKQASSAAFILWTKQAAPADFATC